MKIYHTNSFYIGLLLTLFSALSGCSESKNSDKTSAYLFTYFTGNAPGEEAIRFAVSTDGYHYLALNNNEP
ncbi:MAG: hypothetical protein KDE26_32205, partial [Bacteroidetes bacterium]|nr:hypothetical protein [Bacteroidota bacterium]